MTPSEPKHEGRAHPGAPLIASFSAIVAEVELLQRYGRA
jgi:hypothetical protein